MKSARVINLTPPELPQSDLEKSLLAQIARLEDPACDIEKEARRANAIIGVGNVIVNATKAKIDLLRTTHLMNRDNNRNNEPKRLGDGK